MSEATRGSVPATPGPAVPRFERSTPRLPTDAPAPQTVGPGSPPGPNEAEEKRRPRWPLFKLLGSDPTVRRGFSLFVTWWLVAALLAMAAAGNGYAVFSIPSLIVGAVDLVVLIITLGQWRRLNPGFVVLSNTVVLCIWLPFGNLMPALALASIAVMFGAAESAQRWWYATLEAAVEHDQPRSPDREQADLRSSFEVAAIAAAAAAFVSVIGFFESRVATVAALVVFALIFVGVWFLGRSEDRR